MCTPFLLLFSPFLIPCRRASDDGFEFFIVEECWEGGIFKPCLGSNFSHAHGSMSSHLKRAYKPGPCTAFFRHGKAIFSWTFACFKIYKFRHIPVQQLLNRKWKTAT